MNEEELESFMMNKSHRNTFMGRQTDGEDKEEPKKVSESKQLQKEKKKSYSISQHELFKEIGEVYPDQVLSKY